jgi:hypothetical protein
VGHLSRWRKHFVPPIPTFPMPLAWRLNWQATATLRHSPESSTTGPIPLGAMLDFNPQMGADDAAMSDQARASLSPTMWRITFLPRFF